MSEGEAIQVQLDEVRAQLRTVHRVRGKSMAQAARRSKRLLPRAVRKDAQVLVDAERQLGNPLLERQVDMDALGAAQGRVLAHLGAIDLADRRRGRLLSLAGVMAFNLLAVGGAVLAWMAFTGQL